MLIACVTFWLKIPKHWESRISRCGSHCLTMMTCVTAIEKMNIQYITYVTGLPAHQLEIKVGDMIVEVNGTDVTRANGRMVAEMIK